MGRWRWRRDGKEIEEREYGRKRRGGVGEDKRGMEEGKKKRNGK